MNPRHIALGLAVLAAGALALFGDKTPDSGVAEAVERKPAVATTVATTMASSAPVATRPSEKKTAVAEPAILRLLPRTTLIGEDDEALGGSADVFGRRDWTPPPPPQAAPLAPPPAPAPVAPPLPFTYLGKAVESGQWEVFLAIGEKTYVVRNKMVIDGMYRVDAIAPPNLTLTYLPLNQVQQLNIGVLD
jgi:hypothetical protein